MTLKEFTETEAYKNFRKKVYLFGVIATVAGLVMKFALTAPGGTVMLLMGVGAIVMMLLCDLLAKLSSKE
jgi:hypothetical protein